MTVARFRGSVRDSLDRGFRLNELRITFYGLRIGRYPKGIVI